MKTVEITCVTCGTKSQKRKAEIDRRTRLGKTKFYCGNKCAGKNPAKYSHLNKYAGEYNNNLKAPKLDELSPFRYYYNTLKSREKSPKYRLPKGLNLSLEYLKEVWESQKGICPFTGWELILRTNSNLTMKKNIKQASLDRIDNSKGYIEGNIRFIAVIANYARNNFEDKEVIEFCKAVVKHNP